MRDGGSGLVEDLSSVFFFFVIGAATQISTLTRIRKQLFPV